MSLILKDCIGFCDVYMDDIIIYSDSIQLHLQHVATVLQTLRRAHLKVKLEKCTFRQTTVEFLGHVLQGWEDMDASGKAKGHSGLERTTDIS